MRQVCKKKDGIYGYRNYDMSMTFKSSVLYMQTTHAEKIDI